MSLCGKIILKFRIKYCLYLLPFILCLFLLPAIATAQITDKVEINTIPDTLAASDSMSWADSVLLADSLAALNNDTTAVTDTVSNQSLEERLGIKISPDALTSVVTTEASDSAVMNMKRNVFYLYGNAKVNYEDMALTADHIIYDQDSNLVTAAPKTDSALNIKERPTFTQGQEKFTYDSLQYNFKSKRAIVRNARSQYGEGYVYSMQVKRNPDQSIYGHNNVYTTCALDTPHFGIAAKKIKVIPGKVVASGPANVTIEQVPTPLYLPFGLFPIAQGQRSGIILPTYTLEDNRGLGLTNGGYYFALSDYVDLKLMANIFSKGSWNTGFSSDYINKYRYRGNMNFYYSYDKRGETYEPDSKIQKDFKIGWNHTSDPKSRPGVSFNATVNAGTATYNQNNTYTVNQILENQLASSIAYTKIWQNKPYTLTIAARHSQNTQSRLVDVTLPELTFYIAQFNPFQKKNSLGTRWYEKITASYNLTGKNQTSFYDTAFSFNTLSTDQFQNGLTHSIPLSASYNVLRFINMSFSANYREYWLTQQTYRFYNHEADSVQKNITRGFYTARDFNAGVNFNTRIYGMKMFKKGKIMGIRHVLSPTAGLVYTPDYAAAPFRYGYQTIIDPKATTPAYLPVYENAIPGVPGYNQFGKFSSNLTFGLDNNLQMKVRSTDDSTGFKNIRLIDNFNISSAYNLAADSFNWQPVNMRFATNILNIINIQAGATYDLYPIDTDGVRQKIMMIDRGMGLARFTQGNAGVDASFRSKPKDADEQPEQKTGEYNRLMQYGGYNDYLDFNIPWTFRFSYTMQVNKNYLPEAKKDTVVLNHSVMFGGDFNLTSRWKVELTSGYNLTQKQLTITNVRIIRDLHCWQMVLGAIPFGANKHYNFTLNAKASVLQDLKLMRRRDYRDATY
jgi:lipopolysaccharide assembly outer membrane protein LptD (OstA)